MFKIAIPAPCHEDWSAMAPNEQGRHCNVCCKTVVDFTGMNDEQVKYFFINKKKEQSVCGRFKNEQLQRITIALPYNIYTISMPVWKQFLTACLLAFSSMLFSCNALVGNNILGETMPMAMANDNFKISLPATAMLGAAMPQIDTPVNKTCNTLMGDTAYIDTYTKGEMSMMPVENNMPDNIVGEPAIIQVDTPQTFMTGKIAYNIDTTKSFNSIDTVKPNALKMVPPQCDNENNIVL